MMFSITFSFDRETVSRLGKRMGHAGTPISSMELDKYIRYIVKENFKSNEEDTRSSLRIKKKRH